MLSEINLCAVTKNEANHHRIRQRTCQGFKIQRKCIATKIYNDIDKHTCDYTHVFTFVITFHCNNLKVLIKSLSFNADDEWKLLS